MFSIVLDSQLIHSCNFCLGNTWREGIRFNDQLYGLVETFEIVDQTKALCLARELTTGGKAVLVTGGQQYQVWLSLSSQF